MIAKGWCVLPRKLPQQLAGRTNNNYEARGHTVAKGDYETALRVSLDANIIRVQTFWPMRNSTHEWWGPYSREQTRSAVQQIRRLRKQLGVATGNTVAAA